MSTRDASQVTAVTRPQPSVADPDVVIAATLPPEYLRLVLRAEALARRTANADRAWVHEAHAAAAAHFGAARRRR